jgi:DNA-binding SARP family transcriptional activator
MERMSEELRISLLGSLVLAYKGVWLPANIWRSRQERRLLAILLTMRGTRVPAERLIEWLWPEADLASAAATLRSTVSGLRHTLEPERGERASSRYILTRQGGYAWNMESGAWVDVDAFLVLTNDRDTRADRDTAAQLDQALALYQGDYLADEADSPWADRLRELLHERFIAALHDLAELRLSGGEYEAAIALARRGLEHDRLREPLYRTLMRAQARAGDVASALQTYERCRRLLDEELGAPPSAQTRALHSAILRGDESRETARQADQEARRPADRTQISPVSRLPSLVSHLVSPFVGRANELAALRDWMNALDQRRGGVVAVVGEAGIGKTRLIAEALRGASSDAFTIALRCTSLERRLPFVPLSEALRPLLRAVPLETLQRLPPVALAQVAGLLPVLRERLPDLPVLPSPPPGEGRNYLLDGIVDVALALSREHPLIIWCDDAQWADEATLAALGRLSRHTPRQALLLLLAYRSEELV